MIPGKKYEVKVKTGARYRGIFVERKTNSGYYTFKEPEWWNPGQEKWVSYYETHAIKANRIKETKLINLQGD
jgi:hypothetical protein